MPKPAGLSLLAAPTPHTSESHASQLVLSMISRKARARSARMRGGGGGGGGGTTDLELLRGGARFHRIDVALGRRRAAHPAHLGPADPVAEAAGHGAALRPLRVEAHGGLRTAARQAAARAPMPPALQPGPGTAPSQFTAVATGHPLGAGADCAAARDSSSVAASSGARAAQRSRGRISSTRRRGHGAAAVPAPP
eukprot:SAG31_NODE_8364_length_1465_cov_1.467789_1_plen_195_part_00